MRDIQTNISYYNYDMCITAIILFYKYPESRLKMKNLSPLDLLVVGGRQGGTSIQAYHTMIMICTSTQLN